MSIKVSKEGLCISSDRRIPATIATQFPDNYSKPFWSFKDTSPGDDFFDCYASFKELGCHEYLWQWQSRKLDENLVKRLLTSYKPYFKENPLGTKTFLTYAVSEKESIQNLGKLYFSIIAANELAKSHKLPSQPLFEVMHPSADPDQLLRFTKLYNETAGIATEKFRKDCRPKVVSLLPVHDFTKQDWYSSLGRFMKEYGRSYRCKIEYIRPVIPRAALAEKTGSVAATLLTKRAIASYHAFAELAGISAYPVIDASTLMFRGGLNPHNAANFFATYPGARSVTITPSFRFDYDLRQAQEAIETLNKALQKNAPARLTPAETATMRKLESIFVRNYAQAISKMPGTENIARLFESKRAPKKIPPPLRRSFALYSLGIPPEMIGTGRALLEIIRQGLSKELQNFYPNIKSDLAKAGELLNKENLKFLAKTDQFWKGVANDISLVEDYADATLGPTNSNAFLHRNHTSNVFHSMTQNKDFSNDLAECARLRRALG